MQVHAASVPERVAALIGAVLLFVLPIDWRQRRFTLTWQQAAGIDWGIILLYGGGLALRDLAFHTGLAGWLGAGLTSVMPVHTELALTIAFTAAAIVLSEATSNAASANMDVMAFVVIVAAVTLLGPLVGL